MTVLHTNGGGKYHNGVDEQAEPNSASSDQTGGRQHAVAGFERTNTKSGPAGQGIGADLLARHDGHAASRGLGTRSGRRAQRRETVRQGGERIPAPRTRRRRRRTVYSAHQRAELE